MYSSSFPFISSLPSRIILQICKNTLLISRQKWQPPPMTSAPCIQFFFPFSFSFFISCTAPETQILSHCPPLSALNPIPSHLHGHNDMSHSILDIDSHRSRHGLNIIPYLLCSEYMGKQQTYIKTQIQIHPWASAIQSYLILNQFKIECWSSCLQMTKLSLSPSLPLFNPKPTITFSSLSEGLFLGLLHPATLRALCDSNDKEVTATAVPTHLEGVYVRDI